jgi:hypothetical protein
LQNKANHNSILLLTTLVVLAFAVSALAQQPDMNGVYINRRPMNDLKTELQKSAQDADIYAPFRLVISGDLGLSGDGKTVKILNPKLVSQTSDEKGAKARKLAQDVILAVSDAGWFGYFYQQMIRNVTIDVEQDEAGVKVDMSSNTAETNDARNAASGFSALAAMLTIAAEPDDKEFLKYLKVSSKENVFRMKFDAPQELVKKIIERTLNTAPAENTVVNK